MTNYSTAIRKLEKIQSVLKRFDPNQFQMGTYFHYTKTGVDATDVHDIRSIALFLDPNFTIRYKLPPNEWEVHYIERNSDGNKMWWTGAFADSLGLMYEDALAIAEPSHFLLTKAEIDVAPLDQLTLADAVKWLEYCKKQLENTP